MHDPFTLLIPRSPELLQAERTREVARASKEFGQTIEAFTCDTCKRQAVCTLAFDPMNTEDDCLWEK